jgi:hypothetical protein
MSEPSTGWLLLDMVLIVVTMGVFERFEAWRLTRLPRWNRI